MAKIIITIQDEADGKVGIEIDGDFENDLAKCSPAQTKALEGLGYMLRDVNLEEETPCGCSHSECGDCDGDGCTEKK